MFSLSKTPEEKEQLELTEKAKEFLPLIKKLMTTEINHFSSEIKDEDSNTIIYNDIFVKNSEDLILKGTAISECICQFSHAHDRTHPNNTRTKVEDLILNHIHQYEKDQPINLLSLGSGMLLQDLLIIISLIKAGFYSINLKLVEIIFHENGNCCVNFNALILALKMHLAESGITLNIAHEYHDRFNPLKDYKADILYAIDYEECIDNHDYTYRIKKGSHDFDETKRELHFGISSYNQVIAFMKAENFLRSDPKSLAIISRGPDIYSLNNTIPSQFNEYKSLDKLIYQDEEIAAYYINTSLCHLLVNMQYFLNHKKTILINKNILKDEKDIAVLEKFLEKNKLPYQFINEKDEAHELNTLAKKGKVIVLDYTVYNEKDRQHVAFTPVECNHPNIHFIRCDWSKAQHLGENKRESEILFPSLATLPTNEAKKMQSIDENIIQKIPVHITDISQKKFHYLKLLEEYKLSNEDKNMFAAYLLKEKTHLLKMERHFFRWNSYSNQTHSFHKSLKILLGDTLAILKNKLYINDQVLTRHVSSLKLR